VAQNNKIIGIILAGGQSKRFGEQKAFAIKEGKLFYQYSIEAMESFTSKIYLVSHPDIKCKFESEKNVIVIQDNPTVQGFGPLSGIYSVMEKEHAEWFLVLPIDCPFITKLTIEKLISFIEEDKDAIVPVVDGKQQPLIAIYNIKLKTQIYQVLKNGDLSMQNFLKNINVKFVYDFKENNFININFQHDYEKYIK
jgi:molybdopterin-guanine dinucleotide biosynthesis protein A